MPELKIELKRKRNREALAEFIKICHLLEEYKGSIGIAHQKFESRRRIEPVGTIPLHVYNSKDKWDIDFRIESIAHLQVRGHVRRYPQILILLHKDKSNFILDIELKKRARKAILLHISSSSAPLRSAAIILSFNTNNGRLKFPIRYPLQATDCRPALARPHQRQLLTKLRRC